jgi:hypothetical protein
VAALALVGAVVTVPMSTTDAPHSLGSFAGQDPLQALERLPGSPSGQWVLLTALALGPHTFTVTATDLWGNSRSSSVTFNVVVTSRSIAEEVDELVAVGRIAPTQRNPLVSKLEAAASARDRGQCTTSANLYGAFIREVQAQSGKDIDTATAHCSSPTTDGRAAKPATRAP